MRLSNLSTKLYYKVANNLLRSKKLTLSEELAQKRCLFLYFDYEREFGGHTTKITDKNINELLDVLFNHQIQSTWFTVVRIFEKYPYSIASILKYENEIGSHTYNHIPPLNTSHKVLKEDFEAYRRVSESLKGFHSPKGQWSLYCLKLLGKYSFHYDVAGIGKNKPEIVSLNLGRGKKIIRMYTVGDDYSLLNKKLSDKQVFDYFTTLLRKIDIGCIGGIGFHPWVLFSDSNIFKGFCLFLDYISSQKDITINPAGYYIQLVRTENRLANKLNNL